MCLLLWKPCRLAAIRPLSAELLFLFGLQPGALITGHGCILSTPVRWNRSLITCRSLPPLSPKYHEAEQHSWMAGPDPGGVSNWHAWQQRPPPSDVFWPISKHSAVICSQIKAGADFYQFVVLFTSVTHRHKPKHQMGEKKHKDLSVIHTKPESLNHRAASGRCRAEIWGGVITQIQGPLDANAGLPRSIYRPAVQSWWRPFLKIKRAHRQRCV